MKRKEARPPTALARWTVELETNTGWHTVEVAASGAAEAIDGAIGKVYARPETWHVLDSRRPVRVAS